MLWLARRLRDKVIPFIENSEIVKFRQKAALKDFPKGLASRQLARQGRRQKVGKIKVLCCYLIEEEEFKSPVTFENWYKLLPTSYFLLPTSYLFIPEWGRADSLRYSNLTPYDYTTSFSLCYQNYVWF